MSRGISRSCKCFAIIQFLIYTIYTSIPPLTDDTSSLIGFPKLFFMNWQFGNDESSFLSALTIISILLLTALTKLLVLSMSSMLGICAWKLILKK